MKLFSVFFAALVTLTFIVSASAQNEVNVVSARNYTLVFADQPDCPLRMSVWEGRSDTPLAVINLTNTASSSIRAYVLIAKRDGREHSYTGIISNRFMEPGKSRPQGVSAAPSRDNREPRIELFFDYIQFTDGSGWGPDTLGNSSKINAFIKGRKTALTKLTEILAGGSADDFLRTVNAFDGHTRGEDVRVPHGKITTEKDYFSLGYDTVIRSLRSVRTRSDEAKELARQIELAMKAAPE